MLYIAPADVVTLAEARAYPKQRIQMDPRLRGAFARTTTSAGLVCLARVTCLSAKSRHPAL